MSEGGILRLLHCRPRTSALDEALRARIVPDLRAKPGLECVWAGRQGPDDTGPRILVSVWSSDEAMRAALPEGDGSGHPEDHPGVGEPEREVYPIVRDLLDPAPFGSGILRVARGVLRELDVERYAARVLDGVEEDRSRGHGPHAFVLAAVDERTFVNVSAWEDWKRIEIATGASVQDPIRTRRPTELDSFDAQHYEVLVNPGRGAHPPFAR